MTKTQANEPGFVLSPCPFCGGEVHMRRRSGTKGSTPGTRSRFYREHVHCEKCGASGPEGKAPNASVRHWNRCAAAPIVPAPAYGVKELEWSEDYADTSIGRYAIRRTPDGYEVSSDGEEIAHLGFDAPRAQPSARDAARDYAQADFERRILSCLSSAPVEEADAKAGETVASDFLSRLRAANRMRDAEYRAKTNGEPLPILFRTTEFAGEVGELLNVIKKMERERLGWGGKRATREAMLEEFGGVLATLDLLAMSLDVDLAEATAAEFNAVTIRLGLTTCLTTPLASTIPSEPEAKGEAGAGPVGEAVAWQWRSRFKGGGAWDAWENGRFGKDVPPFLEVEERPRPVDEPGEVERLVEETGSSSADDLRDMALVGHSLMEVIGIATADGPYKDWTPADNPTEIVIDLINDLEEALESKARLVEAANGMASSCINFLERLNPFNMKSDDEQQFHAAFDACRVHYPAALASEADAQGRAEGSDALAEMREAIR